MCIEKILLKHMQVMPCFEDLFKRNPAMQAEFEFEGGFENCKFFKRKK